MIFNDPDCINIWTRHLSQYTLLVLIALASSHGSDKPVKMCSHIRALVLTYIKDVDEDSDRNDL